MSPISTGLTLRNKRHRRDPRSPIWCSRRPRKLLQSPRYGARLNGVAIGGVQHSLTLVDARRMPHGLDENVGKLGRSAGYPVPRGAFALALSHEWRQAGKSGVLFVARREDRAEYLGANVHALFP